VPEGFIVVGCVDKAATRRLLGERLSAYEDVVYVDAGNVAVELRKDGPLGRAERAASGSPARRGRSCAA
jgi:hypothetical protein